MYASQTKRLCVRGAPSDDSRVQHHSLSEAKTETVGQPNILSSPKASHSLTGDKMIASASGTTSTPRASIRGSNTDKNDSSHSSKTTTQTNNLSQSPSSDYVDSFQTNVINLLDQLDNRNDDSNTTNILLGIRNQVTASNKKKDLLINHPDFTKLVRFMKSDLSSPNLKCHIALLLCSLSKSGEHVAQQFIHHSLDTELFRCLSSNSEPLAEASLRCLRSILCWPSSSDSWIFYPNHDKQSENIISNNNRNVRVTLEQMLSFTFGSRSIHARECVADILAYTCMGEREQTSLYNAGALESVYRLLESISSRVVIASINLLTQMCSNNRSLSLEVTKHNSGSILNRLKFLMRKDKCPEMQFLAARCYTYIFRAIGNEIEESNQIISREVLPTLIRMVKEDQPFRLRSKAAECIAYLIELDKKLQETASNCEHLIDSLVKMLDSDTYPSILETHNHVNGYDLYEELGGKPFWVIIKTRRPSTLTWSLSNDHSLGTLSIMQEQSDPLQENKQAAFLALAALGSTEESIRKKIFNNSPVMQHIVKSLSEPHSQTLKSALTCLLSLSRSVHQLRTTFVESSVYNALKSLLATTSDDILILVLSILCNVSIEFSPGKQQFLDPNTIEKLCNLTHRSNPVLRLHGIWILMNIVYEDRTQGLKFQILSTLGLNHVIDLIENETNEDIVLKTLGFLRNVLSQKGDIDAIMKSYGAQIMQSLISIIESKERNSDVREQALCVLTNIADGQESKKLLMDGRILNFMAQIISDESAGNLRLAAICCITNLIHKKNDGSYERRVELKKYGIDEKLKGMLNARDPALSDRVRTAYNQFASE